MTNMQSKFTMPADHSQDTLSNLIMNFGSTKAKKGAPWMHCRGYIGIFKNERDEYKYYGKVYLPEIEQDEQYHEIMK